MSRMVLWRSSRLVSCCCLSMFFIISWPSRRIASRSVLRRGRLELEIPQHEAFLEECLVYRRVYTYPVRRVIFAVNLVRTSRRDIDSRWSSLLSLSQFFQEKWAGLGAWSKSFPSFGIKTFSIIRLKWSNVSWASSSNTLMVPSSAVFCPLSLLNSQVCRMISSTLRRSETQTKATCQL